MINCLVRSFILISVLCIFHAHCNVEYCDDGHGNAVPKTKTQVPVTTANATKVPTTSAASQPPTTTPFKTQPPPTTATSTTQLPPTTATSTTQPPTTTATSATQLPTTTQTPTTTLTTTQIPTTTLTTTQIPTTTLTTTQIPTTTLTTTQIPTTSLKATQIPTTTLATTQIPTTTLRTTQIPTTTLTTTQIPTTTTASATVKRTPPTAAMSNQIPKEFVLPSGDVGSGVCSFPTRYKELNMYRLDSDVSEGWAMPGPCLPNRHCVYACASGYVRTSAGYSESECIPGINGCPAYDYKTSKHGLYCDSEGKIQMPDMPLCQSVPTYTTIINKLSQDVTSCATVYPGSEDILNTPFTIEAGTEKGLTLFPSTYWRQVSAHYYVAIAGGNPTQVCRWKSISPVSSSSLGEAGITAYIWGGNLKDIGGSQPMQAINFDFSENYSPTAGSPGYYISVERCENNVCRLFCEVKRKVVNGATVDYSALYDNKGNKKSESTTAKSSCYGYEKTSVTFIATLLPYN